MEDITKAIQGASLRIWDQKIPDNTYWKKHGLLDSSGAIEEFRQTLYVHVMKNEKEYNIYDNNKRPKVIVKPQSYMIKFGKTDHYADEKDKWKGIINRRQDDFKSHYHHRTGIGHANRIPLTPPSSRTRIHPRHPHLRIGSEGTILHLLIDLNKKDKTYIKNKEQELKEIFKSRFLGKPSYPGAEFIKMERINIPIASVRKERNFIEHVREVFERFEDTL